jgi:hypothetical protein
MSAEISGRARAKIVELRAQLAAVTKERDELRALIAELVEAEELCRYDHDGFCQEHYYQRPCIYERMAAALQPGDDA